MTTLVLLHGWGAGPSAWQRQVGWLRGEVEGRAGNAGRDACATGFPRTTLKILTPAVPSWEAGWLADFLGNLPLAETILVGWSLGGMLLLETLARTGVRPAHTVLVGAPAVFCRRPDHSWGQPPGVVRAMRRALKTGPARVLRDFAAQCLAPGEGAELQEAAGLFSGRAGEAGLAQGLDYLLNADLRPVLPRLTGPVTLIQGEADAIVEAGQARYLQEHLPGSRLFLLPGAGHLPFWTRARSFNQILHDII